MDPACFIADHHGRAVVAVVQQEAEGDLHEVVADDGFQAFPFRDVVPFELVFGRMDAMGAEEVVGVEEVEEGAGDGVDDGGQDDCEDVVADPREEGFLLDQGTRW